MKSKYHWNEEDVVITRSVEKHLSGKHNQSNHAGSRGIGESVVASGSGKATTAPKAPKKTARQKEIEGLRLGVDYDSSGYPLDNGDGVVARKLTDVHGLYDEASDEAMAIADRGPKKLLMPRDKDGLPQMLTLKKAENRYGKTTEEIVANVEEKFGVKLLVQGRKGEDVTVDTLHGIAQAIEELSMNGIKVDEMTSLVNVSMSGGPSSTLGSWMYTSRMINIYGGTIANTSRTSSATRSKPSDSDFGVDTAFISANSSRTSSEGQARSAYGTFIHEVGHAMDFKVGQRIQSTREKIINQVFEGTGLIRSDWASTPRGRDILYRDREVNSTTYYDDLGAIGLVRTRRDGTIDPNAPPSYGNVDRSISVSQYATYTLRENYAESFTAYWLYGASKGAYKSYYDRYKGRVGNIIDMSQGVIKAVNPIDSGTIYTDITKLPPTHPLIVWITGIVPS